MLSQLKSDLKKLADPQRAKHSLRFFKTGKGQYGEGDRFYGLDVPTQRKLSRQYKDLTFDDLQKLLDDPFHECRLIALMILVDQYRKSKDIKNKQKIVEFYMKNASKINNWDLVDLSAPYIPGNWYFDRDKTVLYDFARSGNLWQKRIAIMTTFGFIKKDYFNDTFAIAEILLHDKHDLIHKAVGWMLREIGKRNQPIEETFLQRHCRTMPRTMLRYAIEKFEEEKRQQYLKK